MFAVWRQTVLSVVVALSGGCASFYFQDAGAPPSPPPRYELAHWPYEEYWTRIVFNGARIGFSHLQIEPAGTDRYALRSQAVFHLRFLGFDKRFQLNSRDVVRSDLTLERFQYDLNLDGSRLKLDGHLAAQELLVEINIGGNQQAQRLPLTRPVYPTSAIPLYPLLHGLEVGRRYRYMAYDGELQTLAEVEQDVLAYERSELFDGPAYKIRTRLHGYDTTAWIAIDGKPKLELALNGVLISALETEREAQRFLVSASVNKQDVLLDFSLVPAQAPIPSPRRNSALTVEFDGLRAAASDARQRCAMHGDIMRCEIDSGIAVPAATQDRERYLRPTIVAPSFDPRIREQARAIAGAAPAPREALTRLLDWMERNIAKEAVDAFSALDVLDNRRAECQGHAYLYAAFARALDIPTRVVNGLVYSEEHRGFLYHTWNESLVDGVWMAVDPTFNQLTADATHVKLVEGELPADLLPLLDYIGRIRARIITSTPPR